MDKIARLVEDHFPWGQPGYPPKPADPADRTAEAEKWIAGRLQIRSLDNVALALHARIQKIVDEVESTLPATERPRFFYRSDVSHLVKSPKSVLDKMVREWKPKDGAPKVGFDDFLEKMDDLVRFRIVLNFLSDVKDVCDKIEEPYKCKASERSRLTPAQQALMGEFRLDGNRLRNLIRALPAERRSAERCRKGVFFLPDSSVKIEVQIQTMLQEAWDKKDHFLIYERRRRGDRIDEHHSIEIYAMSELLYVADLTFDRLLDAIRHPRRKKK
ncbi:MAG TPA: RelA/SpoT domain-containing protein [Bryobacteraceae bacterium]|nr:RelA/SpoT domain-containing protein [Bryobacteraceae bacterium]